MAAPIDDISFDLHDNKAFVFAEDDPKEDDINTKLSSDTTESSFQLNDNDKKTPTDLSNAQDELRTIITVCIVFGVSVAIALILTIYLGPPQVIPHGVVSSTTASCSEMGSLILKVGGSAADTSIAVIICESIIDPSIILGCGILTYHDQRKNYSYSLDFSCSNAHLQMSSKEDNVIYPTLMRGIAVFHDQLGMMKWKDILQLVINNFHTGKSIPKLFRDILTDLTIKGVDYFYDHPLQVNWTSTSDISLKDMKSFKPTAGDPQKLIFKGYSLESVHGWTSSSMFMVMTILEHLTASGKLEWNSTEFYHYFIEASKLVETNLHNITKLKTSDEEWKTLSRYLASLIKEDKVLSMEASDKQLGPTSLKVSIIGPNDDLISAVIWHNNTKDTYASLNTNQDASTILLAHNLMKPCAIRFAAASSNHIGLAQVLIKHFGNEMNLTKALMEPKLYPMGNVIFYEENFQDEIIKMLVEKGHSNLHLLNNTTADNKYHVDIVWKDGEDLANCTNAILNNVSIF